MLRWPSGLAGSERFNWAAPSIGVEIAPISVHDASEIERDISGFARLPNGGLIVTGSGLAQVHRNLIITLAARHKLPGIYFDQYFVAAGGLISYGPDPIDGFGSRPATSIVFSKARNPPTCGQAPTKYELAINRKTAMALGLTVPPSLLARADQVIE